MGVGLAAIHGSMMGSIRRPAGGMLALWIAHVLTDMVFAGIVLMFERPGLWAAVWAAARPICRQPVRAPVRARSVRRGQATAAITLLMNWQPNAKTYRRALCACTSHGDACGFRR